MKPLLLWPNHPPKVTPHSNTIILEIRFQHLNYGGTQPLCALQKHIQVTFRDKSGNQFQSCFKPNTRLLPGPLSQYIVSSSLIREPVRWHLSILQLWFQRYDEPQSNVLYLASTASAFGHICFKSENIIDIDGNLGRDLSGKLVFNTKANPFGAKVLSTRQFGGCSTRQTHCARRTYFD